MNAGYSVDVKLEVTDLVERPVGHPSVYVSFSLRIKYLTLQPSKQWGRGFVCTSYLHLTATGIKGGKILEIQLITIN